MIPVASETFAKSLSEGKLAVNVQNSVKMALYLTETSQKELNKYVGTPPRFFILLSELNFVRCVKSWQLLTDNYHEDHIRIFGETARFITPVPYCINVQDEGNSQPKFGFI